MLPPESFVSNHVCHLGSVLRVCLYLGRQAGKLQVEPFPKLYSLA